GGDDDLAALDLDVDAGLSAETRHVDELLDVDLRRRLEDESVAASRIAARGRWQRAELQFEDRETARIIDVDGDEVLAAARLLAEHDADVRHELQPGARIE